MTRYFFHMRDSHEVIKDPEGKDFADLAAAQAEAMEAGREMMAELVRTGQEVDGQVIEICQVDGTILSRLRLRDVVRFK